MKTFEMPEAKVILFANEDVILTSDSNELPGFDAWGDPVEE